MVTWSVRSALVVALALAALAPATKAAPFKSNTVISGQYLMGVETLAEFDAFTALYPDSSPGFAFTFARNGSVQIFDEMGGTESGTYTRYGPRQSRITVLLTSVSSPYGAVTYELYRVGNTDDWWGEVRIGGVVWGVFRGEVE